MSEMISHDAWHMQPEGLARRALGLNAAGVGLAGTAAVVLGGRIGRSIDLSGALTRLAGLGALGLAGALGVWSVSEEWQPPTRRALAVNTVGAAAVVGHVLGRQPSAAGRVGLAVTAVGALGLAAAQAKALIAAEPHPDDLSA